MSVIPCDLAGKRILVTGGTGFVGARLVEVLKLYSQARVRVVVRDFARGARIARLSVEMVQGDVLNVEDMRRACEGCDIVFHCAYGNKGDDCTQRRVNIQGTKNVILAAERARVKRLVHVSTVAVYAPVPENPLRESSPRRKCGQLYADSKLDAENMVLKFSNTRGLPAVVLQPTVIYGPYAPVWTVGVLEQLKKGRYILVDGGEGLCNAVYIDDVVSGMLLAAASDSALGERFLISGAAPVTWREYLESYDRMLGCTSLVSLSGAEARAIWKSKSKRKGILQEMVTLIGVDASVRSRMINSREGWALRRLGRALVSERTWQRLREAGSNRQGSARTAGKPERPILPLSPSLIRLYSDRTAVSIEKARQVLGYEPKFDFRTGIKITEQWARWANLLG